MSAANPWRGEASLTIGGRERLLRPSFAALVAAEGELGSLLGLVERAAGGELRLGEINTLFWHCLADREGLTRDALGEALVEQGLAACTAPLRALLEAVVQGGR
ncbi:MAG: gene transfer agent family protein [Proteobacteria bacterium]|nr:gene transfer agent family protein [Pseudomonadota bacterium]